MEACKSCPLESPAHAFRLTNRLKTFLENGEGGSRKFDTPAQESARALASRSDLNRDDCPVTFMNPSNLEEVACRSVNPSSKFVCIYQPPTTTNDGHSAVSDPTNRALSKDCLDYADGGRLSVVPTSVSGMMKKGDEGFMEYLTLRDELDEVGGGRVKARVPLNGGETNSLNQAYSQYLKLAPPRSEAAKFSSFIYLPTQRDIDSAISERTSPVAATSSLDPSASPFVTEQDHFRNLLKGLKPKEGGA